ncbi:MAG: 30S ribosomal protein S16 [Bacteroidia bacterium]|nr:30S ribosomal protein S16 [Bacteroidia bacterium]MCZ2247653.1 30S ribosomal protein S16 [Bacteroidia bacterium]
MPVKIRLQRHGKKASAFYHIVIADGRAPRDGRFIEKLGTYNPNTNPATIDLNFDGAIQWLRNGAQPTDTCRAILSYKGVLYKHHLNKGVLKGALTQEAADAKFEKWLNEKTSKIEAKKSSIKNTKEENKRASLKAESAVKEAKAAKIAEKLAAQQASAESAAESTAEATPEEGTSTEA